MKLMTYNILDGAVDTLPEITEIVKKEFPDYLTLNEAFTTEGRLRFDAISKILNTGYYDTAVKLEKNKNHTVPTPANQEAVHSQMRLDYVFISESLLPHLHSYRVVKNGLTDRASDHYPVIVELK